MSRFVSVQATGADVCWGLAALEGDIRALSTKGGLSPSEQTELADLRAELARITKAKTECESGAASRGALPTLLYEQTSRPTLSTRNLSSRNEATATRTPKRAGAGS